MQRFLVCGAACALLAATTALPVQAQSSIVAGSGSYASAVPAAHVNDDGYYGPQPGTVLDWYNSLYLDPAKKTGPIPTNQWWTYLMVGQAEPSQNTWVQHPFGGQLWTYPGMAQAQPTGLQLYYPVAWSPRSQSSPNSPSGNFDPGPALNIDGRVAMKMGAGDVVLGNFSGAAYPAGWVATGDLAGTTPVQGGTWPGELPAVSGIIGNACLNSFRGSNNTMGILTSPVFTIKNTYIDVLSGGGNDTANTCVQLVVNGAVVKTAVGQQDATLRWTQWNVSAYVGKTAQLVVRDTTQAGWGFVLCSYIVATNNAAGASSLYTTAFTAPSAIVTNWSDWMLDFSETDGYGDSQAVTLARGVPFTWARYTGVYPRIHLGTATTLYDVNGAVISKTTGSFVSAAFAFDVVDGSGHKHSYGVFAPDNTQWVVSGDYVEAQKPAYLVYGYLPSRANLAEFNTYAFARPLRSQMSWAFDHANGKIATTWAINCAALKGTNTVTLQGWLPHHYRTTTNNLSFKSYSYLTPRGAMKVAAGNSFQIAWPFRGIAPILPAPHTNGLANDFNASRMSTYMTNFAAQHPGAIDDTYWGGKEFGISAQYMTQAAQLGLYGPFSHIENSLKSKMQDWLTYTPGESNHFFARYGNWGASIGFNSGYGSQSFNDNHFHYGYFALAAALIGMQDPAFLNQYGPMAKQVVKEYGNYDRTDKNFPFLRTFDVWEGHSNAGGFGSGGGENQESSSESMNAWVGTFMLGNMMGDSQMADAGAMGYAVESSAVNEYWQDMYKENLPASYGKAEVGIVNSGGDAYGTYFTGDPAWIYAIQWTPVNHWHNYLARNKTFAASQLAAMWSERKIASQYGINGFTLNDDNQPDGLGAYPGDYVLGFQSMFDPDKVASLLDQYWTAGKPIATDATYPGSVYYLTHTYRALGDQDLDWYMSIPTGAVYFNSRTSVRTYVAYNPARVAKSVIVYKNGVSQGTLILPSHKLVAVTSLNTGAAANTPYYGIPMTLPGSIAFANYDNGGEGLAYHDLDTANAGGQYRPLEGVDVEPCVDAGVGYDVSASPGEWLKYGVQVPNAGTYTGYFRLASVGGGTIHIVSETGANVSGAITVPNTLAKQNWKTVTASITLAAGPHTLKVVVDNGNVSLNQAVFVASGSAAVIPTGKTISMLASSDNQYVTAENGGNLPLIANRGEASGWEQFVVIDQGNGNVALQSMANNLYVSAGTGGNSPLQPTQPAIGPSETFQWIDQGNGYFSLKCLANNKYVTAPNSTTSLTASQASFGTNETFLYGLQ